MMNVKLLSFERARNRLSARKSYRPAPVMQDKVLV